MQFSNWGKSSKFLRYHNDDKTTFAITSNFFPRMLIKKKKRLWLERNISKQKPYRPNRDIQCRLTFPCSQKAKNKSVCGFCYQQVKIEKKKKTLFYQLDVSSNFQATYLTYNLCEIVFVFCCRFRVGRAIWRWKSIATKFNNRSPRKISDVDYGVVSRFSAGRDCLVIRQLFPCHFQAPISSCSSPLASKLLLYLGD